MTWKHIVPALTLALNLGGATANAAPGGAGYVPPVVPGNIEVVGDYKLVLVAHAVGTQNYICAPAATASGVDWLFIGPQATLFDSYGKQMTTHFQSKNPFKADAIQATWHHSTDTSLVWAKRLRGSVDPSYVSPDAIEWLLLEVTGNRVGPSGGQKLSNVKLMQRVNTVGGKAPEGGCTPSTVNTRALVAYEADYYFYE